MAEHDPYGDDTPLSWDTPAIRDEVRDRIRGDHGFAWLRRVAIHAVDEVEGAYKRLEAIGQERNLHEQTLSAVEVALFGDCRDRSRDEMVERAEVARAALRATEDV